MIAVIEHDLEMLLPPSAGVAAYAVQLDQGDVCSHSPSVCTTARDGKNSPLVRRTAGRRRDVSQQVGGA
jgi:hypothetical protein